MKKILYTLMCGLMILSLTGCGENPKLKTGENVLVTFKDEKLNISVEELYDVLKEEYGINYLIELIDEKILNSIYETDEIAENYLNIQVETMESYYGGTEKFLETLQSYGYESVEEFKENLLINYKRDLAVKDYIRNNLKDSEIEKYYNNEIFGDITASHILISVETDKSMTEDEIREVEDAAKKKIDEILKKLKEGADFHELAKEYSDDKSSAINGGRLNAFNKGEMVKEFEKAAMNLEVGKYTTSAVLSEYGYHIIYKEAEKDKPSLKDVKETIIKNLIEEKLSDDAKLQYKALIELRKDYGITINDEDLNTYYDNAVNNWLYSKED